MWDTQINDGCCCYDCQVLFIEPYPLFDCNFELFQLQSGCGEGQSQGPGMKAGPGCPCWGGFCLLEAIWCRSLAPTLFTKEHTCRTGGKGAVRGTDQFVLDLRDPESNWGALSGPHLFPFKLFARICDMFHSLCDRHSQRNYSQADSG